MNLTELATLYMLLRERVEQKEQGFESSSPKIFLFEFSS